MDFILLSDSPLNSDDLQRPQHRILILELLQALLTLQSKGKMCDTDPPEAHHMANMQQPI